MKKQLFILTIIACAFVSCSSGEGYENALIKGITIPQEDSPQLGDLLTKNLVITALETSDESLIGNIDKIKKFEGDYYISSGDGKYIHRFNSDGKFISSLNKLGAGPEEYSRIEDFDVYEVDGETEVWVSDNYSLKIYDADSFSYKYKIPYQFLIYKFKRIDSSRILLVTGMNERILTISDEHGNVSSDYLEKEIPFIMFRPIQFIPYESNYIFQLGIANAYVMYDTEADSFHEGILSNNSSFLSKNDLLDLFESSGMAYIMEANNSIYISSIKKKDDNFWLVINNDRRRYIAKYSNGKMVSTEITDNPILSTLLIGDSDDSVIFYAHSEDILEYDDVLLDKFKGDIEHNIDDNPYILEFY